MMKVSNIVLVRDILGNLMLNAYIHEEHPLRVNLGLGSTDVLPLSSMSNRGSYIDIKHIIYILFNISIPFEVFTR